MNNSFSESLILIEEKNDFRIKVSSFSHNENIISKFLSEARGSELAP